MEHTFEKLNREKLECISYERSKWWSNFMNEYNKKKDKDNEEIDLRDMENYYNDNGENIESSNSENMAEEAESINSDEDPLDVMILNASLIPQNITQSNARGILSEIDKRSNETGIMDNEVREVLEQTLPIVEEYKRNWREAGFERILNTFDIQKIEEKVGGWMRRNNSFLNNSISPNSKNYFVQCRHEKPYWIYKHRGTNDGSDSDSLHSIDTARYIRSSRKHLGVRKRVATTTTTIKSYCLIESKRDELRRKYAYLAPDDTMKIFNPERCSQSIANVWPECRSNHYGNGKKRLALENHCIRRRRFHHRRHCPGSYSSYSTSDEEDIREERSYRSVRNPCNRCYHKTSKFPPKSCTCQLNSSNGEHDEFLPYVRESECSCRQADKLCNSVRHLANSSSEEWLVENCLASEILPKIREPLPRQKVKRATPDSCNAENAKQQKLDTDNQSKKSRKMSSNKKEKSNSMSQTCSMKSSNKKQTDNIINTEDSFEYQLQQAIKISKDQYERDMKMRNKLQSQGKKNNKSKKVKSICDEFSNSVSENSDHDMLEVSHTSSKLASKFTADLQLEDVEKSSKKFLSKTKSISFGDESYEKSETIFEMAKNEVSDLDVDNSLDIRKSGKQLPMTLTSARGKQIKNVKTHLKKNNDNQKKQSIQANMEMPKTSKCLGNILEHDQIAPETFATNPILSTEETQKGNNIENWKTNGNFNSNKNGEKTPKSYISTSSISSNASSDIEDNTRIRKRLGSKKPTLNPIDENVSEEKNVTHNIEKQNAGIDVNKIQFSNMSENTTFFGNAMNICNSTALNNNNTATTRQLLENSAYTTVPSLTKKIIKSSKATKSNTISKRIKNIKSNTINKKDNIEEKEITGSTIHQPPMNLQSNDSSHENQIASKVNDCTVVSSTTDTDFQVTVVPNTIKKHRQQPDGRFILYTPQNTSLAPDHSIINGRFMITEDHLASVIGKEAAFKFMKYYVGPRDFRLSSTVYYRPPKSEVENVSSDSDMDFLDLCSRYGELHESKS